MVCGADLVRAPPTSLGCSKALQGRSEANHTSAPPHSSSRPQSAAFDPLDITESRTLPSIRTNCRCDASPKSPTGTREAPSPATCSDDLEVRYARHGSFRWFDLARSALDSVLVEPPVWEPPLEARKSKTEANKNHRLTLLAKPWSTSNCSAALWVCPKRSRQNHEGTAARGAKTGFERLGQSARIDQVGKCTPPTKRFFPKIRGASDLISLLRDSEGLRPFPKDPKFTLLSWNTTTLRPGLSLLNRDLRALVSCKLICSNRLKGYWIQVFQGKLSESCTDHKWDPPLGFEIFLGETPLFPASLKTSSHCSLFLRTQIFHNSTTFLQNTGEYWPARVVALPSSLTCFRWWQHLRPNFFSSEKLDNNRVVLRKSRPYLHQSNNTSKTSSLCFKSQTQTVTALIKPHAGCSPAIKLPTNTCIKAKRKLWAQWRLPVKTASSNKSNPQGISKDLSLGVLANEKLVQGGPHHKNLTFPALIKAISPQNSLGSSRSQPSLISIGGKTEKPSATQAFDMFAHPA